MIFKFFFFILLIQFYTIQARDLETGSLKVVIKEGMPVLEFKKINNKIHIFQNKKRIQIITPQGNGGELPVSVSVRANVDFNEDGYLDLLVTEESKLGLNVNSVFLYSPELKQFQKLPALSYLPNLSYNIEKKEFQESQTSSEGYVFYLRKYKLKDQKVILLKEIKQESLESKNYFVRVVKERENEELNLKCEAIMKKEPEFDLAYLIFGDCDSCELQNSGVRACEILHDSKTKPKEKKKSKKN